MKNLAVLTVLAIAVTAAPYVSAAETVFTPSPRPDMWDLDHYRYYTWGVDLGFSTADAPIVEAELTFKNIRNWNTRPNVLYIHLLDGGVPQGGLVAGIDLSWFGNAFNNQGVQIDAWTDQTGRPVDLVYQFSAITLTDGRNLLDVLNQYGSDGYIGFGFDPDCHYYNDGITFKVVTAVVPAPGAVMLAGIGTMLVGWLRRRNAV